MPQKRYVVDLVKPQPRIQEVIPMKNRPYRTVSVKNVSVAELVKARGNCRCDVGLAELPLFIEKLKELGTGREMFIALEPTGTYCDPVRQALTEAGLQVYRVSTVASHNYAETFDGVPSQHDGKDAACVAELSSQGNSKAWPWQADEMAIRFEVEWVDAQQQTLSKWLGRIESLLGRHWPEITSTLSLSSLTLLKMLQEYGGPQNMSADAQAAAQLRRWSRGKLAAKTIEAVVQSAASTVGVRQLSADIQQLRRFAAEALDVKRKIGLSERQLKKLTQEIAAIQRQAPVLGLATSAVLWAYLRDPANYHCAAAYRKAMGLNLKERSSGKYKGQLGITKRGPNRVRRWLYFAALRYCRDPWIQPWFQAQKLRGEGHSQRALVTLMRKLALAAYYVGAKGETFDVRKLLPGAAKQYQKARKRRAPVASQ
jgi:transposase